MGWVMVASAGISSAFGIATFACTTGAPRLNSFVTFPNPFGKHFSTHGLWATKRALLLFFYRSFSSSHSRGKKWIKNCYIHMKFRFVCKHFTYVTVTNRIFSSSWSFSGGNMNSSLAFFGPHFALHYLIWMFGKGVKNELLIRDEQWFLPFQCAPLGPVNFMIKKAGKKKQLALLERNAIQWCIIPNLFSV